jgi:hypothetical protein
MGGHEVGHMDQTSGFQTLAARRALDALPQARPGPMAIESDTHAPDGKGPMFPEPFPGLTAV